MTGPINQTATFSEILTKLSEAKGRIETNNAETATLIANINTLLGQIDEILLTLSDRLLNDDVKTNLITSLNEYISAAESGSPNVGKLRVILEKLQAIKDTLAGQGRVQRAEGPGSGGGRRTKKHKKSKSKGKGKATKSKGRKTRRGRSGKAKKSRSRKHTSKRR